MHVAPVLALAAVVAPAPAAATPETRLQAAQPDADAQTLVLPFAGPTPAVSVERADATHLTVWLRGARPAAGGPTGGTLGRHAWRLSDASKGGAARLELALAQPGGVTVAAQDGRLLIIVQPAPVAEPDPTAGVTTILGRATFDAAADALVVPYYGQAPRAVVRANGPAGVAIDCANTAVEPAGLQWARPEGHPLIASWSLVALPAEGAARIALAYRYTGGARLEVDEARRLLLIRPLLGRAAAPAQEPLQAPRLADLSEPPLPGGEWRSPMATLAPLAAPSSTPIPPPSQTIRVVIDAPAGVVLPGTAIAPAPGLAFPGRQPTAEAPRGPYVGPVIRQVAVETGADFVSESLSVGGIDAGPVLVPRIGLTARYDLDPRWTLLGRFRYMDYTITDPDAPGSRHHRDDFALEAAAAHRLPWGPWQPSWGLGYAARQVSVANSVPASLQRPFVFAPSQFYHGPWLIGRLEGEPAPGWRLNLEASARPYVWLHGDESVRSIGGLFGYGARPELTWQFAPAGALTLGYRLDWLTAYTNDFVHLDHGPLVAAHWRF